MDKETDNVLYSWPVAVLRRYGASNSKFFFESGRRSQTGVGNFIFLTPFCKSIKQAVSNIAIQHEKSSYTDLLKTVAFHESENREIFNFGGFPKEDTKPQLISSNRNEKLTHFSGEDVKEGLRVYRELIKDMGYTRNLEKSNNLKIENDIYEG